MYSDTPNDYSIVNVCATWSLFYELVYKMAGVCTKSEALMYHIVKCFGGKIVWQIRTVGSLVESCLVNWSPFAIWFSIPCF